MFLVTWLFDKVGYMPKINVETTWPFPCTQKDYTPHEFEKKAAKKVVKKATTRKAK
jgi:hypothetical protein